MANETVNVDDALFEVLATFSEATKAVKAPWLIIGATARIMLLEKIYGWAPGVATQDIDFAVQIGDWDHYQLLCDNIIKNDIYQAERKPTKRFRSKEDMVFDLVPYGGVENENKQVFWPPHSDDVMTVRGFESAANDAISVVVNEKLTVPVVSPRGLCALKFFAWKERHVQHPGRDAKDIAYLFKNIELLYSSKSLHENHPQAVEVADYEIQSAGLFQLGCDVGELVSEDDHGFLDSLILAELKEAEDSTLCRELNKYNKTSSIEETIKALNYFYQGLNCK